MLAMGSMAPGREALSGRSQSLFRFPFIVRHRIQPRQHTRPFAPEEVKNFLFLFTMKGNALDPRIYGVRILALKEGRGI